MFLLLFLLLSLSDFLIQKFRPVSFPFLHSRCFAHFPFPAFQFCLHPVFLMHLSQVDSARQVHPAFPVHLFQVHPVHSAFPVHLFQVHPVHSVFPVHLFQVRLVHPAFQVRLVHPAFPVHLFRFTRYIRRFRYVCFRFTRYIRCFRYVCLRFVRYIWRFFLNLTIFISTYKIQIPCMGSRPFLPSKGPMHNLH